MIVTPVQRVSSYYHHWENISVAVQRWMISVMDNWPQILITESSQSKSSQITQQSCGSFMSIHHYSSRIWHRHEALKALPWTWLFTLFEVTQISSHLLKLICLGHKLRDWEQNRNICQSWAASCKPLKKKLIDECKSKGGQACECIKSASLISELRLTVPELMYLFFLIFFFAFTTWYEGGIEKKG